MRKNIIKKLFPFLLWLPKVTKKTIIADIIAGLTGAVIVLPQGIAFATIAGLPPEYGLYTAMITPIIAALFGSSMHLISGPTTAISLVVFSTISGFATAGSQEFISLALTLTLLAGIYQLAFGLAKLGKIVDFVSHTVIIGFTAGAAILIVTSQIKTILGIDIPRGLHFIEIWERIAIQINETNMYALIIGLGTFFVAILIKKFFPKLPNLLFALFFGGFIAYILDGSSNGVKFVSEIPAHLPPLSLPDLSVHTIKQLAPGAFAIALLGLIEAISISRSVASKSHQRINANQEFIGQGLSNMVGSFFSSYAGSGSFTRSGVNYSAGAKTPLSAIFAAIFLALIVMLIAPITKYLPVAAMGGVIILVGYNLINFEHIKKILKNNKTESSILLVTFFSTLFLELEFAIYIGILLSLVLFLNKTSNPEIVRLVSNYDKSKEKKVLIGTCKILPGKIEETVCPQLEIIRIDMSVYFGSVNYIQSKLNDITSRGIKHILVVGVSINLIDMNGMEMLEEEAKNLEEKGGGLYFTDLKTGVFKFLDESGFIKEVGKENFFKSKKEAIETIYNKLLDKDICKTCTKKVFNECGNKNKNVDYSNKNYISLMNKETLVEKIKNMFN